MKKILLSMVAILMATTMSAQTIFHEGFDNVQINPNTYVGDFPTGWVTYGDNQNTNYQIEWLGNAWAVASLQGGGQIAASASMIDEGQVCDRWLITPKINITSANAALKFKVGGGGGPADPEHLKIMISTTDQEKASFTEVHTYLNIGGFEDYYLDLSEYANQEIYVAFVNCGNAVYLLMDYVEVGTYTLPVLSMELASVNAPSYVGQNEPATISGQVRGLGISAITSFDVHYEVNGVASETTHITNASVVYNDLYDFTIEAPFSQSETGSYEVKVFVTNINGDAEYSLPEMSKNIMVYDASQTYERTVLLEHFTTGQCPNCPSGDQRIEAAVGGRNDVIWMAHHAGYYTDQMTIPAHEALTVFFGPMGTFAPAIMLDRTHFVASEPGPAFFPGDPSEIINYVDQAKAVPSFAEVEIASTNFNADTRELTINVTGQIAENFEMESPRLSVYLVEDSLLYPQAGVQGKKYHMHVMRAPITDVWGEVLTEKTINKTYTYAMPEKFKAHRCKVVAFVSNYTQNIDNCKVINADQTAYLDAPYVGIEEVSSNVKMDVYPNPAVNYAKIESESVIRTVRVVNALGQEVYVNNSVNAEEVTLNTTEFSAGMYVVTVKTDDGVAVRRMSVAR